MPAWLLPGSGWQQPLAAWLPPATWAFAMKTAWVSAAAGLHAIALPLWYLRTYLFDCTHAHTHACRIRDCPRAHADPARACT